MCHMQRPLGDGASATLGRYDMSNPPTMSHLYDRVCVSNDVSRVGLYGNIMTSSIGLGPRMVPHSAHHPNRLSGEHRVVVTDPSTCLSDLLIIYNFRFIECRNLLTTIIIILLLLLCISNETIAYSLY